MFCPHKSLCYANLLNKGAYRQKKLCLKTAWGKKFCFKWMRYLQNPSHIRIIVSRQWARVPPRAGIHLPSFTNFPNWNHVLFPLVSDYNITKAHWTLRVIQKLSHLLRVIFLRIKHLPLFTHEKNRYNISSYRVKVQFF